MISPVCVVGAGSWGTALAIVLARHGTPVLLLARSVEKARHMQAERENSDYLPGIHLPDALKVSADPDEAKDAATLVVALPCQALEGVLPEFARQGHRLVIGASKGIHPTSLERPDQLFLRLMGDADIALLSGPSFAAEVARGLPTAITMAAADEATAQNAASLFSDSNFRVYTSSDMIGVALGGALKNVIAIAAGIAAGLELGHNASAALVTRGLSEICRLAEAEGAKRETLMGLAGLGDLVLTCTGALSRNRKLGEALASGRDLASAQAQVGQVAEGVRTARAACRMAASHGVDAPIMQAVNDVIEGRLSATEAVHGLMLRPGRSES
ncbi:MAG: NAD(P)H-dependent glycerol-3-phosphate dehydrogenase [Mariprofundaceae bacterium]